ncbi:hypothetical protein AVEN_2005-1 [Araneus ventricosus]|uniref:Uncharacterized protein n=1 Tax=Araneus ventricosus TaxID=182803 RepID=A0A4Y2LB83_ARAVE|nr:hypothetical protein AVEN_2005-1 [Araneus ventricosus]
MFCEIFVSDCKGIPSLTIEGMRFFNSSSSDELWQLPELTKRIVLLTKRSLYLPDDVLSLFFELDVSDGDIQSLPGEIHAVYPASRCIKPSSTMKEDFRLLYQEQKLYVTHYS